jgi:glycosyltransferase involved in cell wall biosynthesis
VYHMGNNCEFHEEIHDQLQRERGIVVLHDLSLWGFYSFLYQHRGRPVRMREEMTYHHGSGAAESLVDRFFGGKSTDYLEHHMLRRITDNARHIVVHSQFGADHLRRYDPRVRVSVIPHGTNLLDADAQAGQTRASLGIADDDILIGCFGGVHPNKRIEHILDALNALRRTYPQAARRVRLMLTGYDDTEYAQSLKKKALSGKLKDRMLWLGEVPFADFEAYLSASDVVVSLRHPSTGETSGSIMRTLGAGRPVIVSDLPQYADLPESFCWRVPVGAEESDVLAGLFASLTRAKTTSAGQAAHAYMSEHASWRHVARQYIQSIGAFFGAPANAHERDTGVTIVGDLHVDNGLSQAARGIVTALRAQGVPLDYSEFAYDPLFRATLFPPPPAGANYPVRLFMLNAPEFDDASASGSLAVSEAYNIGYWFYELPHLPDTWRSAFAGLDEIWVATRYVQANLQAVSPIPVRHVPLPLDVPVVNLARRHFFDWPDDKYTFLYSFSALGSSARKNPFGVIEAFQKAFRNLPGAKRPLLVLKAHHLDHFPALLDAIKRRIHSWPIKLMLDQLSREEMYGLIGASDCYVSLHRSEGLGLGMAEAMALGRPVIGTGWSGNMDFMNPDNSFPVPFTFVPVSREQHRYQESHDALYPSGSAMWTEPDTDEAARMMRQLFDQPETGRALGAAAASDIRARYGLANVGQAVASALDDAYARAAYADRGRKQAYQRQLAPAPLVLSSPAQQGVPMNAGPQHSREPITVAGSDAVYDAFKRWDAIRLRDTDTRTSRFMRRIPLVGYLYRVIVRVMNLGHLEAAQMHMHREMLAHLAQLSQIVATTQSHAQAAEEISAGLETEIKGSIWPRLDSLETTREHTALEMDTLRDHLNDARDELAERINSYTEEMQAVVDDFAGEIAARLEAALAELAAQGEALRADIEQNQAAFNQGMRDRMTQLTAEMAQQRFSVGEIARELQTIVIHELDALRETINREFAGSMNHVMDDVQATHHALTQRLLQLEQQTTRSQWDNRINGRNAGHE